MFMYQNCNSMNNLSSYCGLVDAKIRASDKDLPVNAPMTAALDSSLGKRIMKIFQTDFF